MQNAIAVTELRNAYIDENQMQNGTIVLRNNESQIN